MDNNHTVEEARYSEATDFLGEVGYPDLVCPALNIENPNVGLPVNMVLVQVNPSETFIIRNEDGSHRTFTGPTEVPMVSPGRNIPTIYAPPGYISHVIDEQGIRRVVVLHDEQAIRPTGHQISQQQYPIPVLPPRNEAYNSTPEGHFVPVPAIDPAEEPGCESVQEWLNKISTPQVKSVSARTALVTWNGPTELHKSFNHDNVVYQLSVEGKKGFWDQVDCGQAREHLLTGLSPGSKYVLRLHSTYFNQKVVNLVEFMTLSCIPDPPQAPKSTNRTKNSLLIKWSVPVDNGERIKNYHLEWDSGSLGSTFSLLYTGHHKQYKVLRLQPSHQYQFRVSAENVHGLSDPSFVATFHTQQSVPSTPAPPQLNKSLINALHLSWIKGGSNVIGYTLEKCDGKNEYGFLPEYDGIETKCIVKGLTPNSHYKFRLRCYNEEGTSKWSDVSSFVTCPDIPCPPSRPRVLGCVHAISCNLAWDPPQSDGGSPVDCYILEIAAHKSMEVAYTGKLLECSLSHLTPGHSYRVRVFCVTCGGRSKPSEILEFRCPPVQPGPCEPPTITHQSKPTSISLEWASPAYNGGSEVTTYKVRYSPSIDSGVCVNFIECHGHNVVISNLKPATSYSFSLQALNCIGAGDWSEWLQVMTAANVPDQPSIPTVSKLGPTMMQLNWEHPSDNGSPITGYLLQFGKDSLLDHQLSFTSLYTLCDLTPNTSYYFSLQAINKVGKSVMSNVGDITTPPGPPSHVTKLQVSEVGSTVMVCWDTPNDRGSPITAYHVFITHGDETNTHILPPDVMSWTFDASQDTIYSIQVGSSNEVGHGELSESIKFELAPAPPVPPILSGIESSTGLKLSWVQTHKKQLLYLLQIKDKHDRFVTIYEGSSCSYRVNRLLPGTTYKFRIRASNNSGPGPFSNEFVISTRNQTSTAIQPPTISEISPTSCSLTWLANSDKYTIHLVSNSCNKQILCKDNWYELHDLSPDTEYKVQVAAVSSSHASNPSHSAATTFKTLGPVRSISNKTNEVPENNEHAYLADGSQVFGRTSIWSLLVSGTKVPLVLVLIYIVSAVSLAYLAQYLLIK